MAVVTVSSSLELEAVSNPGGIPWYDDEPALGDAGTPTLAEMGDLFSCARVNNLPISESPVVRSVTCVPMFEGDYYGRIHVLPADLDLGNVLEDQTQEIEIWNAYETSRTLSAITGEEDGLTLTGPSAPPTIFGALESRTYDLEVDETGSPSFDFSYSFEFDSGAVTLSVSGQRVILWPFHPEADYSESLEWKTDVIPTVNAEQRLALRLYPRQGLSFEYHLEAPEYQVAKGLAASWSYRLFGVPVWGDLSYIGAVADTDTVLTFDTRFADYRVDGLAVVWQDFNNYVIVEIDSKTDSNLTLKNQVDETFTAAYVMPVRIGRTRAGINFTPTEFGITKVKAEFFIEDNQNDIGATSWDQFQGVDVVTDPYVRVTSAGRVNRLTEFFDNGSGPIAAENEVGFSTESRTLTFDAITREEAWNYRTWLYYIRGRQKSFYLPSWEPDLTLVSDIADSDTGITVSPFGYARFYETKRIVVVMNDGTMHYNTTTGASLDVDSNEVLSLDAAFGVAIAAADVQMICFLDHLRFNADSIKFKRNGDGRYTGSVPVITTPEGA